MNRKRVGDKLVAGHVVDWGLDPGLHGGEKYYRRHYRLLFSKLQLSSIQLNSYAGPDVLTPIQGYRQA